MSRICLGLGGGEKNYKLEVITDQCSAFHLFKKNEKLAVGLEVEFFHHKTGLEVLGVLVRIHVSQTVDWASSYCYLQQQCLNSSDE